MGSRMGSISVAAVLLALVATKVPASAAAPSCPRQVDPAAMASAASLKKLNTVMDKIGPRPTGTPAHQKFVAYLENELEKIPGVSVRTLKYRILRRDIGSATLSVPVGPATVDLPVAAPVPYAGPGANTAPLVRLPDDQPITAANAAGRIVVREAPAGEVPVSVFSPSLLGWWEFDPDKTIDQSGAFRGDFLNYDDRLHDME